MVLNTTKLLRSFIVSGFDKDNTPQLIITIVSSYFKSCQETIDLFINS